MVCSLGLLGDVSSAVSQAGTNSDAKEGPSWNAEATCVTPLGAGTAARPPFPEMEAAGLFVAGPDLLSSPRCFPDEGWTVGGVSKGRSSLLSQICPWGPGSPLGGLLAAEMAHLLGPRHSRPPSQVGSGRPCPPEPLAAPAQTSSGAALLLGEVPWG